ncbi:hypothetical protein ICW40_14355 [Actinotalea ferrariae]|uniref:hypothetical protein n=1 Tax=Actinotalea ferrariae TaxID=1386098 RepID=UPI001C8C43E0|nr:hypothetical protein [Actinotalea ferrariae]MBX9245987.1 hypothetical protein [Actinotalea ferrariae]
MAGVVFLPDSRTWTSSSSVFSWMLDVLAPRARDPELVSELRTVSDNNLGALDLADMPAACLAELTALVAQLPAIGREELPDTPARPVIVEQLVELAEMLGDVPPR